MVTFGICSWIPEKSQLPELERCLESVKNYNVILVDGKWYDIDHPLEVSIPEAFEVYKKYPNVKVIISPNKHEWENRNIYLKLCKEPLIWLDTDEYVITHRTPSLPVNSKSFYIEGYDKRCGGMVRLNRGYTDPSNTEHRDRHNKSFCDGEELKFDVKCSGIIIHHDKSFRSENREKIMLTRNQKRPFR